ncbi:hypothetical protein CFREI_07175 [Corynebacterium freiburgense]|nr:hypothetical protein CFREI_07175 [Corynebacterium freiburgense]
MIFAALSQAVAAVLVMWVAQGVGGCVVTIEVRTEDKL